MVTMVDEIFDRGYQAARADLNARVVEAFRGIGQAIGDSFQALHRAEWSAPWSPCKTEAGAERLH
jgi:hypothetical protein